MCFEQKYEKCQSFFSEIFQFLEVKFTVYLNRHVFGMHRVQSFFMRTTKTLIILSGCGGD